MNKDVDIKHCHQGNVFFDWFGNPSFNLSTYENVSSCIVLNIQSRVLTSQIETTTFQVTGYFTAYFTAQSCRSDFGIAFSQIRDEVSVFFGSEDHVALDRNPVREYNTIILRLIPGDLLSACPHI